nr:MAG TPA_asm: hypothetical protein [Caudoviricetes sp.]
MTLPPGGVACTGLWTRAGGVYPHRGCGDARERRDHVRA